MAIKPVCDVQGCGCELEGFGGIYFGKPAPDGKRRKLHVCPICHDRWWSGLQQARKTRRSDDGALYVSPPDQEGFVDSVPISDLMNRRLGEEMFGFEP